MWLWEHRAADYCALFFELQTLCHTLLPSFLHWHCVKPSQLACHGLETDNAVPGALIAAIFSDSVSDDQLSNAQIQERKLLGGIKTYDCELNYYQYIASIPRAMSCYNHWDQGTCYISVNRNWRDQHWMISSVWKLPDKMILTTSKSLTTTQMCVFPFSCMCHLYVGGKGFNNEDPLLSDFHLIIRVIPYICKYTGQHVCIIEWMCQVSLSTTQTGLHIYPAFKDSSHTSLSLCDLVY